MNAWGLLAGACAYGIATTIAVAWFAHRADTARLDQMAAEVQSRLAHTRADRLASELEWRTHETTTVRSIG